MTVKEAYHYLYQQLEKVYEEREARNITSIIFEDAFSHAQSAGHFSAADESRLKRVGQRLAQQEPWQYVLGQADFYGLKFKADKRALIPRPETEELVHQIIKDLRKVDFDGKGIRLLDIGTGTGCIPLTIKHHMQEIETHALDVSKEALVLAAENAKTLNLTATFHEINILEQSQWKRLPQFDLIVSNPPYITDLERPQMTENVLKFEPALALFVPNESPLLFYKTIADFALLHLKKQGKLYFESNEHYAREVELMLIAKGFKEVAVLEDMHGKDRMLVAQSGAKILSP